MNRRKIAFASLSVSLVIGLVLSSLILDLQIPFGVYLCSVFLLFVFNILLSKSFKSILRNTITLSDKDLERKSEKACEIYLLSNIDKIKIKTTTKGTIREIYIWFCNGQSMFINGLEKIEEFRSNLLSKIDKKITVKKITEPIDFDHPLFYPALGLVISFACVYLIKLILNLDELNIKVVSYAFLVYVLAVGLYFIFLKPIAKRYGSQKRAVDYIFGITMVCAGMFFLIVML